MGRSKPQLSKRTAAGKGSAASAGCPVRLNDVIKSSAFRNAWRDGEKVVCQGDRLSIADGDVWVSHQSAYDMVKTVRRRRKLTDAERVAAFEKSGKLGPKTKLVDMKVSRAVSRSRSRYPDQLRVIAEPSPVSPGIWHIQANDLDPVADIGRMPTVYNFYLVTEEVRDDRVQEGEAGRESNLYFLPPEVEAGKTVLEIRLYVLPSQGQPLFGDWCKETKSVRIPAVGNILSGAELRWYMSGVDRRAEYLVTQAVTEKGRITVCCDSHSPRDCSDDWCGIRHSHKNVEVESGVTVTARRVEIETKTGKARLLGEEVSWFLTSDRDFTDSHYFDGNSVHVGGDRHGNYDFSNLVTERT